MGVFHVFILYKWYQITQSVSYIHLFSEGIWKSNTCQNILSCIDEEPVGTKYMVTYRKGVIQRKLVLCPRLYFYNTGNYII